MPIALPPITKLVEALQTAGLAKDQRAASGLIKKGLVTVNGVRVANADALLVLTGTTTIQAAGLSATVVPQA